MFWRGWAGAKNGWRRQGKEGSTQGSTIAASIINPRRHWCDAAENDKHRGRPIDE